MPSLPMHTLPISLLMLGVVASSCSSDQESSDPAQAGERANVLLIVVDTLRADRMSAYGYSRETTPVLTALAEEGVLASDVTAQASWTLPSMVSLMQGRYVTSYRDMFFKSVPTLAESFRDAGYRTLGVVGNGLLSAETGFDRGFEYYESRYEGDKPGRRPVAARDGDQLLEDAAEPLERLMDLDEDGDRVPFFAYLHFMDPHGPYLSYPEFSEALPLGSADELWPMEHQRKLYADSHGDAEVQPHVWKRMTQAMARYDQEVRASDRYIGEVCELLKEKGLWENTIVVVVSDHGESLWGNLAPPEGLNPDASPWDYFFRNHGMVLSKSLISTPMIMRGPGIPKGVRIDTPVENVDLFPTLMDLCKLNVSDGLQGRSLTEAMANGDTERKNVFSSILQCRSVRTMPDGYKLVLPLKRLKLRRVELYDTIADPGELYNIAEDHPEVVTRLTKLINDWVKRYPVKTTLGRKKSEQNLADLEALGYATGQDDEDSD